MREARRRACDCRSGWGTFLHVRHRLIMEWTEQGRSAADIAETLSMDSTQVRLIAMTPLADTHIHLLAES